MAGDWIKWTKGLAKKREVLAIASALSLDRRIVASACMEVWEWADDNTENGHVPSVTESFIDCHAGINGLAAQLTAYGWLLQDGAGGIIFPKFDRHNGKSAKNRVLASERKRKERDGVTEMSRFERDKNVTRGEESERREEKITSRKEPIGKPLARSTRDFLDLGEVDWSSVLHWVESAARRIPPKTLDDRRAWLKYGVMAWMQFSEAWLIGAADAVANTKAVKNRAGAFVTALRNAAKEKHDVDRETFDGIFARIEIPAEVWKSDAIKTSGGGRHEGNRKTTAASS